MGVLGTKNQEHMLSFAFRRFIAQNYTRESHQLKFSTKLAPVKNRIQERLDLDYGNVMTKLMTCLTPPHPPQLCLLFSYIELSKEWISSQFFAFQTSSERIQINQYGGCAHMIEALLLFAGSP